MFFLSFLGRKHTEKRQKKTLRKNLIIEGEVTRASYGLPVPAILHRFVESSRLSLSKKTPL